MLSTNTVKAVAVEEQLKATNGEVHTEESVAEEELI